MEEQRTTFGQVMPKHIVETPAERRRETKVQRSSGCLQHCFRSWDIPLLGVGMPLLLVLFFFSPGRPNEVAVTFGSSPPLHWALSDMSPFRVQGPEFGSFRRAAVPPMVSFSGGEMQLVR